ncbi:MAG: ATP-binding cassette domain-containing protein [Lactimicrobium sp.]|jgi:ABC-2 type transport system ATP-binding protein|uniref:ABC transporter ATP-binding protein n=1 Tax=Lactimicrobium sp. TaxID=2563780 RepID=UPI002F3541C4
MKLTISHLQKSFTSKQVLKDLCLQAESGSALGLLGRNGAGKTTTIRILLGLFPADSGEILLDGRPIDRKKVRFGYLPEEKGLYPKKKILDQLIYFAQLKGMSYSDAKVQCMAWLKKFDLDAYANKKLDTLSKGNQQKAALITALVHDPDIVILDEPFSGLDPVNARVLEDAVKEQIARGKIVFFSSHQMNYIEEFCNHIAILRDGKIVLDGTLNDIRASYPQNRLLVRSKNISEIIAKYQAEPFEMDGAIITMTDENNKHELMQALSENYDLDEMRVMMPTLAEIFVSYAGKEKKA